MFIAGTATAYVLVIDVGEARYQQIVAAVGAILRKAQHGRRRRRLQTCSSQRERSPGPASSHRRRDISAGRPGQWLSNPAAGIDRCTGGDAGRCRPLSFGQAVHDGPE